MSNVIRFMHPRRHREEARHQASTWLARIDAGLSAEDQEKLDLWLNEDALHGEMLLEMAAFWDRLSVLSELSDVFPLQRYHPGKRRSRRRLLLAAAGLATALPLGGILLDRGGRQESAPPVVTRNYETGVGEQNTINLTDGSEIVLNTNTSLEVSYSSGERRVVLRRGEALFTVAGDPARPFRVYAGESVVEAVGTAFTVQRREDDGLEVMVTEGRVNVLANPAAATPGSTAASVASGAGGELSLQAGEYLRRQGRQASPVKVLMEQEEMQQRLSWRSGMLLFRGDTLEHVLAEASRYTTIRLELDAGEEVLNRRTTGLVSTGDIEQLISFLEVNFDLSAEHLSKDHVLLTAR